MRAKEDQMKQDIFLEEAYKEVSPFFVYSTLRLLNREKMPVNIKQCGGTLLTEAFLHNVLYCLIKRETVRSSLFPRCRQFP